MRKTDMTTLLGALMVAVAGLLMGSGAWPFKLMRKYRFEHWWFVGMLVGLVIMPWGIMLAGCRHVPEALGAVPWPDLLLGNFFALGWGIANVLCGLCFVRIGVALTGAILAGLGVSIGAIVPMVFKGSGQFKESAGLGSPAGLTVLAGVAVMLVGVVLAAVAGFGRDRELRKMQQTSGGFLGGLVMAVIAGVLSSFFAFAFVYSQARIIANLSVVEPDRTIGVIIGGGEKEEYRVSGAGRSNSRIGARSRWAGPRPPRPRRAFRRRSPGRDPAWRAACLSRPAVSPRPSGLLPCAWRPAPWSTSAMRPTC